jgi:hypothetical protein
MGDMDRVEASLAVLTVTSFMVLTGILIAMALL